MTFDDYDVDYLDIGGYAVTNGSVVSPEPNPLLPVALSFVVFAAVFYAVNVWIAANLWESRSLLELRTTTVLFFLAASNLVFSTILVPLFVYSLFEGRNVFEDSASLCFFQASALVFWRTITGICNATVVAFHMYALNTIRARSTLPKPADLSQDIGVIVSLYLVFVTVAALVLIPDILLVERKVLYDYRSHHCLFIPYSKGVYSIPFGSVACGTVLPIATILLVLVVIARVKRSEPRHRLLRRGLLFHVFILLICLLQIDLPLVERHAHWLETLIIFRPYAVGMSLPLLFYFFVREVEDRLVFLKKEGESAHPLRTF